RQPRNPVEPEPRPVADRHLAEPPPGDQEGLGDDVGRVLWILDPPDRVLENRPPLLAVELGEPRLRQLLPERVHLDLTGTHPHLYVRTWPGVAGGVRVPAGRYDGRPL